METEYQRKMDLKDYADAMIAHYIYGQPKPAPFQSRTSSINVAHQQPMSSPLRSSAKTAYQCSYFFYVTNAFPLPVLRDSLIQFILHQPSPKHVTVQKDALYLDSNPNTTQTEPTATSKNFSSPVKTYNPLLTILGYSIGTLMLLILLVTGAVLTSCLMWKQALQRL